MSKSAIQSVDIPKNALLDSLKTIPQESILGKILLVPLIASTVDECNESLSKARKKYLQIAEGKEIVNICDTEKLLSTVDSVRFVYFPSQFVGVYLMNVIFMKKDKPLYQFVVPNYDLYTYLKNKKFRFMPCKNADIKRKFKHYLLHDYASKYNDTNYLVTINNSCKNRLKVGETYIITKNIEPIVIKILEHADIIKTEDGAYTANFFLSTLSNGLRISEITPTNAKIDILKIDNTPFTLGELETLCVLTPSEIFREKISLGVFDFLVKNQINNIIKEESRKPKDEQDEKNRLFGHIFARHSLESPFSITLGKLPNDYTTIITELL